MTKEEIPDSVIELATKILEESFNKKHKIYRFKFDENQYFETDIDLFDVCFTKKNLHENIKKLILCYEHIMRSVSIEIDFISANDDTNDEVSTYEQNQSDIGNFGLFVTSRVIPEIAPYYSSTTCNAYVNLLYVSFGVYSQ